MSENISNLYISKLAVTDSIGGTFQHPITADVDCIKSNLYHRSRPFQNLHESEGMSWHNQKVLWKSLTGFVRGEDNRLYIWQSEDSKATVAAGPEILV